MSLGNGNIHQQGEIPEIVKLPNGRIRVVRRFQKFTREDVDNVNLGSLMGDFGDSDATGEQIANQGYSDCRLISVEVDTRFNRQANADNAVLVKTYETLTSTFVETGDPTVEINTNGLKQVTKVYRAVSGTTSSGVVGTTLLNPNADPSDGLILASSSIEDNTALAELTEVYIESGIKKVTVGRDSNDQTISIECSGLSESSVSTTLSSLVANHELTSEVTQDVDGFETKVFTYKISDLTTLETTSDDLSLIKKVELSESDFTAGTINSTQLTFSAKTYTLRKEEINNVGIIKKRSRVFAIYDSASFPSNTLFEIDRTYGIALPVARQFLPTSVASGSISETEAVQVEPLDSFRSLTYKILKSDADQLPTQIWYEKRNVSVFPTELESISIVGTQNPTVVPVYKDAPQVGLVAKITRSFCWGVPDNSALVVGNNYQPQPFSDAIEVDIVRSSETQSSSRSESSGTGTSSGTSSSSTTSASTSSSTGTSNSVSSGASQGTSNTSSSGTSSSTSNSTTSAQSSGTTNTNNTGSSSSSNTSNSTNTSSSTGTNSTSGTTSNTGTNSGTNNSSNTSTNSSTTNSSASTTSSSNTSSSSNSSQSSSGNSTQNSSGSNTSSGTFSGTRVSSGTVTTVVTSSGTDSVTGGTSSRESQSQIDALTNASTPTRYTTVSAIDSSTPYQKDSDGTNTSDSNSNSSGTNTSDATTSSNRNSDYSNSSNSGSDGTSSSSSSGSNTSNGSSTSNVSSTNSGSSSGTSTTSNTGTSTTNTTSSSSGTSTGSVTSSGTSQSTNIGTSSGSSSTESISSTSGTSQGTNASTSNNTSSSSGTSTTDSSNSSNSSNESTSTTTGVSARTSNNESLSNAENETKSKSIISVNLRPCLRSEKSLSFDGKTITIPQTTPTSIPRDTFIEIERTASHWKYNIWVEQTVAVKLPS